MEKITHHEFQLLIGLAGVIAFFTFAGLISLIEILTNKKETKQDETISK